MELLGKYCQDRITKATGYATEKLENISGRVLYCLEKNESSEIRWFDKERLEIVGDVKCVNDLEEDFDVDIKSKSKPTKGNLFRDDLP